MRPLQILVLAGFGAFSMFVMWEVGYLGIWQAGLASLGAQQVLLDLVVMSCIVMGLLWQDAQRTGRAFWPYALITLAAGSFGPLLYLLLRPTRAPAQPARAAA